MIYRTQNGVAVPVANMSDNTPSSAAQVSAVDTQGILGQKGATVKTQPLLDKMADEILPNDSIAYIEETLTATRAYSAGQYVYVKSADALYRVTAAVASGGALAAGTNIQKTTIGDEISALNSQLKKVAGTYTLGTSFYVEPYFPLLALYVNDLNGGGAALIRPIYGTDGVIDLISASSFKDAYTVTLDRSNNFVTISSRSTSIRTLAFSLVNWN